MEEEKKTPEREEEQALPVQELPTDIPAEVRQKLAEDLNEQATEDLKQDVREAEKEEANDEEVKANPEMLTKSRLLKLLVKKQYVKLREVTEEEQPADLAELLEELDENNRLVVFRLLKKDVATEAFAYMSDEARDDLVNAFSDVELVSAIEDMSLDDAADLLEDMPAGVVKRVLEKSSRQTRESLNKLLNYPESSAGSLMTPEYVRLRQEMTVGDAFAAIRKQGENAETVYTCYVVERNRLLGVVSARSLLLSDPSTPIVDIMDDNVVTVKVTDDQEYVAREMQRYDFTAMPVLDNEGMFVGIITIDDAIDVLTDESTEDMQKMAAILPDDDATTYFGTSVWTHAKQRIPWLLILMLSATFTGMVTTHYEEAFVSLPLLVSFMPMLMDTAGNCGNQISTLMVRGLALGEVEPSDFLKVLGKELRVSAIVGAVLGLVNGLRIYLMYTYLYAGQYDNVIGYAVVVSVSLFFSVSQRVAVLQRHPRKAGGRYAAAGRQEAGRRPGHHGDPLHHHHRGRLQLDPLLPDRTGCLPRHDVNTQKRPCSGNAERGRSVSQIQQGPRLALAATPEGVLLFGVLLWCEEESCARGGCGPAPL